MKKKQIPNVDDFAKNVRALFEAFLKVGFNTEQAFALTLLVLKRE